MSSIDDMWRVRWLEGGYEIADLSTGELSPLLPMRELDLKEGGIVLICA